TPRALTFPQVRSEHGLVSGGFLAPFDGARRERSLHRAGERNSHMMIMKSPLRTRARSTALSSSSYGRALEKLQKAHDDVYAALMDTGRPPTALLDSWDVRELESGEATRDVERKRHERLFERLRRIDEAIARAAAGTYGRCLDCDRRIPEKRLELDPAA